MSLYDASTEVVKQGGTRRGANMGILRVDHPDILEFIDCKQDITKITNFNISVAITDAFMNGGGEGGGVRAGEPAHRRGGGALDAREVFDKIVQNAWRRGSRGSTSSTGRTTTTRCRTWGATRRRTPAASSRCCPSTSATWAR
jgi:ribonucleoside-diphosphate reductase alpha chain